MSNSFIKNVLKCSLQRTIVEMILIFLLSGIFSQITTSIGCSDHLVSFVVQNIPSKLIVLGIFITTSLISTSLGTSFGSIIIMSTIAFGLSKGEDLPNILNIISAVISGAYFGDNISFISDTTIAAIKSQKADLLAKFKENLKIIYPLFILICIYYYNLDFGVGNGSILDQYIRQVDFLLITPYIGVIVLGLIRVNVLMVLMVGIIYSISISTINHLFGLIEMVGIIINGVKSVIDLVIITSIISLINGVLQNLKSFKIDKYFNISKKRNVFVATFYCFILNCVFNIITANNTIAIILIGQIVYDIFSSVNMKDRHSYSAAILDNLSCGVHGVLPHAPQVLLIASIFNISPFLIVSKSYYCMGLIVFTLVNAYIKAKFSAKSAKFNS